MKVPQEKCFTFATDMIGMLTNGDIYFTFNWQLTKSLEVQFQLVILLPIIFLLNYVVEQLSPIVTLSYESDTL